MDALTFGVRLYLAFVLVSAGFLKAMSIQQSARALQRLIVAAFGVRMVRHVVLLAWIVVGLEICIAAGLLVADSGAILQTTLAIGAATFALFLALTYLAWSRQIPCGCFGSLSTRPAGTWDISRGALMFAAALFASVAASFADANAGARRPMGGLLVALLLVSVTACMTIVSGLKDKRKADEARSIAVTDGTVATAVTDGTVPTTGDGVGTLAPRRVFLRNLAALGVSLVGTLGLGLLPGRLGRPSYPGQAGASPEDVFSRMEIVTSRTARGEWIRAAQGSAEFAQVLGEAGLATSDLDWQAARVWRLKDVAGLHGVQVPQSVPSDAAAPTLLWFGDHPESPLRTMVVANGRFGFIATNSGELVMRKPADALVVRPTTFVFPCQEDVLGYWSCGDGSCSFWYAICEDRCKGPLLDDVDFDGQCAEECWAAFQACCDDLQRGSRCCRQIAC